MVFKSQHCNVHNFSQLYELNYKEEFTISNYLKTKFDTFCSNAVYKDGMCIKHYKRCIKRIDITNFNRCKLEFPLQDFGLNSFENLQAEEMPTLLQFPILDKNHSRFKEYFEREILYWTRDCWENKDTDYNVWDFIP
jgi:hypothetical protein